MQSVVRLALSLVVGVGTIGMATQVTWAGRADDRLLLAQQIVDGLPPAPTTSFGAPPLPAVAPQPTQVPSRTPSQAPSLDELAAQRYLVLVNGDSPLLLEQVRKVESGAFLQTFDDQQMIQAGSFMEPAGAERQVQNLERQGIGAEIIPVSVAALPAPTQPIDPAPSPAIASSPVQPIAAAPASTLPPPDLIPVTGSPSREVVFGQVPSFDVPAGSPGQSTLIAAASSYYVVIPGRVSDLPAISDQVIRLGEGLGVARALEERRSPLGPHVLVGPFSSRTTAERWNSYLRTFGMDARVYYRR